MAFVNINVYGADGILNVAGKKVFVTKTLA